MTAENLTKIYKREKLFKRLAGVTLALCAVYVYLAISVVFGLVGRETALEAMQERQTAVIALETEYLGLAREVTLKRAYQLGFHDVGERVIFAEPLPAGQTLALSHLP